MFTHILVPLDGSPEGERILPWLRPIARDAGGIVRLLRVLPPGEPLVVENRTIEYVDEVEARIRDAAAAYLHDVALPLLADGIPVATEVRFGDPVESILAAAREWDIDLIALATRGLTGVRNLRWPSVADQVLRRSPMPVLLARRCGQRTA